ncbi:MAG: hypothetical protein P1T08_04385 [Acidimicrobiia bacterium]|nr:hypothetical protein [Acidimicrobiia bacterium]
MKLRRNTGSALFLAVLAITAPACESSEPAGPIIATVDGRPVYESVADSRIAGIAQLHGGDIEVALGEDWRVVVLRTLTDDIIVEIEAEERGVAVSDGDVDQALDDLRAAIGGGDEWEAWLAQNGIDEQEARRRLYLQESSSRVYRAITEGIEATEENAEAYYNANPDQFKDSGGTLPFIEVRNSLMDELTGDMQEAAFVDWLETRRDEVEVEVLADDWK